MTAPRPTVAAPRPAVGTVLDRTCPVCAGPLVMRTVDTARCRGKSCERDWGLQWTVLPDTHPEAAAWTPRDRSWWVGGSHPIRPRETGWWTLPKPRCP